MNGPIISLADLCSLALEGTQCPIHLAVAKENILIYYSAPSAIWYVVGRRFSMVTHVALITVASAFSL